MKTKLTLIAICLLALCVAGLFGWRKVHHVSNESYLSLSELPGVSQQVLDSQNKLFRVDEPVLFNRKTGMAFFVVEILSRQNFGDEQFLTFGGDAKSLQNFVSEINLVNNGASRTASAGQGMTEGIESMVSGLWQLIRHPIDTAQGLGTAAYGLAIYLKDTPVSQATDDVKNLVSAYYINKACEISEQHGADYYDLKTDAGRATIHSETNWKLGGQATIEIATILVPFSELKYGADAAEAGKVAEAATEAAQAARTATRLEEGGAISAEAARFSRVGSLFPTMVGRMTETLARLKDAAIPRRFVPPIAKLGSAATSDYKLTFFKAHPDLEGKVVVHHAVEQQALTRYPGLLTEQEMHSLENLRGIPIEQNADMHLSQIRKEWNEFYRDNPASGMTKQRILDKASEMDRHYGSSFTPTLL